MVWMDVVRWLMGIQLMKAPNVPFGCRILQSCAAAGAGVFQVNSDFRPVGSNIDEKYDEASTTKLNSDENEQSGVCSKFGSLRLVSG